MSFPSLTTVFVLNFCYQGQQFVDGLENTDFAGLARIISMLLDSIEMKAEDVANWPNVSLWLVFVRIMGL